MYYYLYDSCLNQKKYNNLLAKVETRLTDLGINGKINYLSFLKNIEQILQEEIKRGVKTVVVVGNDRTFGQTLGTLAGLGVTIGLIPIDKSSQIAKFLGLPDGERACDTISSRIIKKIDLGQINNCYFFTSLEAYGPRLAIEFDNNYLINLENKKSLVKICNLGCDRETKSLPDDGQFDVFIKDVKQKFWGKKEISFSRLTAKMLRLTSPQPLPIFLIDEKKIIKTPATVNICPSKIKLIVGKNRIF